MTTELTSITTPKKRKSRRTGESKPAPYGSVGKVERKIREAVKSTMQQAVSHMSSARAASAQKSEPELADLHHKTEAKSDPQLIQIQPLPDEDFDDVTESKPVSYESQTEWLRKLSQVDEGDTSLLPRPSRPPPLQELEEEPEDPNMPRGGALWPKHINMGPYSVPMKNLSDNQQDIHEQLLNLQQKASTNQTYDDLILNENLRKLRGVMGPWNQSLAPAKTFRSENFLYTGVDSKENLNGDALALGRPTRHYKITSTRPVTTDPMNERDPQFRVYNPAITRLPGISFFSSL